jgi:hypothetical protein
VAATPVIPSSSEGEQVADLRAVVSSMAIMTQGDALESKRFTYPIQSGIVLVVNLCPVGHGIDI